MPFFGRSQYGYLVVTTILLVVVFVAAARWTRDGRRVRASVSAGSLAGAVNVALDMIAHHYGWWEYTEATTSFGPLAYYVLAALGMASFALLGLRLRDRFGWRAIPLMAIALFGYGIVRDQRFADRFQLMAFDDTSFVKIMDGLFEYVIPFLVAIAATEALLRIGPAAQRSSVAVRPKIRR